MINKKNIFHGLILACIAIFSSSCLKEDKVTTLADFIANENLSVDTTSSGLIYQIFENGNGEFPLENSKISVILKSFLTNGEIDFQTQNAFAVYLSHEPILVEAAQLMSKGGRGIFIFTPQYINSLGFAASNPLIYELDLEDIFPGIISLDEYAFENNLEPETTASGLQYVITKQGSGATPTATSRVEAKYKGFYTNGDVFDQTKDNLTATFGLTEVIKGWQEGLQLISEGGSIILLIPSELGYGANPPNNSILPNVDLVFEVSLEKVL